MIRIPQKIKMIKTDDIYPNPYQTRRKFERSSIVSLSESIKEVGILSPIIVRGAIGGYELICGQRRLRAAIMAGIKELPAIVVRAGDMQCSQISMIENCQRENLTLCEEAEGYFNLMSYHRVKKDKLIKALSVSGEKIKNRMRLLTLSEEAKRKVEEENLSEKAVKELLKLYDEEEQLRLIEKISGECLNNSAISSYVRERLENRGGEKRKIKKAEVKNSESLMPLCINTVEKTLQLLKSIGITAELEQTEKEECVEFVIRTYK